MQDKRRLTIWNCSDDTATGNTCEIGEGGVNFIAERSYRPEFGPTLRGVVGGIFFLEKLDQNSTRARFVLCFVRVVNELSGHNITEEAATHMEKESLRAVVYFSEGFVIVQNCCISHNLYFFGILIAMIHEHAATYPYCSGRKRVSHYSSVKHAERTKLKC